MTCPYYKGNKQCDLKSESYNLCDEHIKKHCEAMHLVASEQYPLCEIFSEHLKENPLNGIEKKITQLPLAQESFKQNFFPKAN